MSSYLIDWSISVASVGTEEMAHWEMIGTMIHQCMTGATCEELRAAGLDGYYVIHSHGVFPVDPNGVPFTSSYIQCTGDPIADISEDMAAAGRVILMNGCRAVLVKGGHLRGHDMTDVLVTGGHPQEVVHFHATKIDSRNTHGTGCTLSSAIASYLARGENMPNAVAKGKQFLSDALAAGKDVSIGKGHGPLNHFFAPEKLIIK